MTETPETVGDVAPDRPLWKTTNGHGARDAIHLAADCHKLADCESFETVASAEHDSSALCDYCTGQWDNSGAQGPQLAAQIKGAWADD